MRLILLLFLFIFSIHSLFGQLPEFQTNVSETDLEKLIVLKKFETDYQQLISFTYISYWGKYQEFYVILLEGENWVLKKLSVKVKEDNSIKRSKTKNLKLNSTQVDDFINFLNECDFWNFSQDSLNWNKKDQGNGTFLMQSILDGHTDEFLIRNGSKIRISKAHNADHLQEFVPTEQRKKFVEVRNRFYELIKQS